MSRPRLVEEGVPIGSTNHTFQDEEADMIAMDMDHEIHAAPPIQSSLANAAGGRAKQPRRTTFRTVIGGDDLKISSIEESHFSYRQPHSSSPCWNHRDTAPYTRSNHDINNNLHHPPRRSYHVEIQEQDVERMEGVEDHGFKPPLVVLDGANIAYGYNNTKDANVRGILVAVEYWKQRSLRVLVVLPQPWFNRKEQMRLLQSIEDMLVQAPSRDDDDAYALQIAMRENARAVRRHGGIQGPAYVVSNDMFRDAQARDPQLADWLEIGIPGHHETLGKGRISYTFANMGRLDDHGIPELDFMPNPKHPLVVWAEQYR